MLELAIEYVGDLWNYEKVRKIAEKKVSSQSLEERSSSTLHWGKHFLFVIH
jgi:hypothetical protein